MGYGLDVSSRGHFIGRSSPQKKRSREDNVDIKLRSERVKARLRIHENPILTQMLISDRRRFERIDPKFSVAILLTSIALWIAVFVMCSAVTKTKATRGEFPSIVAIKLNGNHYCGGSIVNTNWIVTAAHCSLKSKSDYTIVAGEHHLYPKEGSEQSRSVSQIILHPNYSRGTLTSDIALMRVSSPFVPGTYVQTASLASSDPTGNVVVAGWGAVIEGSSGTSALMKVTIPMVSFETCRQIYGSGSVRAGMICAGVGGGDSGMKGDSGGPLYNGTLLSGIASGRSVMSELPGMYTSVTHFRSWIMTNAK